MGIFRHPGITLQLQSEIRLAAPGGQDHASCDQSLARTSVAVAIVEGWNAR
jgi:hypothetical protein